MQQKCVRWHQNWNDEQKILLQQMDEESGKNFLNLKFKSKTFGEVLKWCENKWTEFHVQKQNVQICFYKGAFDSFVFWSTCSVANMKIEYENVLRHYHAKRCISIHCRCSSNEGREKNIYKRIMDQKQQFPTIWYKLKFQMEHCWLSRWLTNAQTPYPSSVGWKEK